MPGYARPTSIILSSEIVVTPTGDISSTNLQSAIAEIASEKATVSSVTAVENNLNTTSSNLTDQISSASSLALLLSNS